jgi:hypothetical protein
MKWLALIAPLITLAACSPNSSQTQAAAATGAAEAAKAKIGAIKAQYDVATPNACVVLDKATATQFLGAGTTLKRQAQPNPHMSQCQYAGPKGMITVMVGPWSMVHTAAANAKAVTGLGDEAYSSPSGLDVRKGQKGVNIDVETEFGEFSGKAADSLEARNLAAQTRVAPAIIARL